VITTDAQVRKLMKELSKHGNVTTAALRSGMDRKTARKYRDGGKLPSEMKRPRDWRTRPDPLAGIWPAAEERLEAAPDLEALALFEFLAEKHPGALDVSHLRTFQRRVKQWRAEKGPAREVFFAQQHVPGEAMQVDFTNANELSVSIAGEPLSHLLCHSVLPYSNWQWAVTARSESLMSLRRGVQSALFELGRRPEFVQTDNSTAATHRPAAGADEPAGNKRKFNDEYVAMTAHFGLTPRTIEVGEKEQNGDVEAANGALKRRLAQHLLLRGSRDFASVDDYESFIAQVLRRANQARQAKLDEEL
jgi:hypothetical protein